MNNNQNVSSFLKVLCSANGTSGDETDVANTAAKMLKKYMNVEISPLGSVIGTLGGSGVHILLDAHIDQIGLVVTSIDETGFLKVAKCGGADVRVLAASDVTVHGKEDIFGVVISTPPHLASKEDEGKVKGFDEIAIDIGLSKEEAEKIVSPGDRITFNGSFDELLGGRFASPCIDDRAGAAAILRALELLDGKKGNAKITVMFSTQEETGGSGAMTGAFSVQADEAIAVDVSFASAPNVSSEKYASLGKGTMIGYAPSLDFEMSKKLKLLAEENEIPFQTEVMGGRTGTNCDEIQNSGRGCRTALLSIPIRNMHTAVEVCDEADIENTARLIAAYIAERGGMNA